LQAIIISEQQISVVLQTYGCDSHRAASNPPTPLLVVLWRPSAQGISRKGKHIINTGMLQLPAARGRESKFLRLSGLQTRDVCKRKSQRALYNIWQGCSLLISLPQVCPLQQNSESIQNSSSIRIHTRLQWQGQLQQTQASLHLCSTNKNKKQVSQFGLLM
jgi:hypothetical protein